MAGDSGMTPAMSLPAISVIVPVYRDWSRVVDLLARLEMQSCRDFEVILVDNDPTSPPPALPDHGLALRVIPCAAPGS